jgi:nicotinamide-nucleotide amidase
MDIEIICTGDEVLTGKIVNANFSYMTQKLEDYGLPVARGATVGDDRGELMRAFREAGSRAEFVIVNGGLGPTVDDLSQEMAAKAAGVGLELREEWVERMRRHFTRRGRTMTENNKKQAMLPVGAEILDNPIGTACGFAVDIGKARFFFTPGVPREMYRMLEEQIVPRILERTGSQGVIVLKRFHSYGIGESHADAMLKGLEDLAPDGSLKLGFRAHYPQLETKLTVRATTQDEARAKLAPAEALVRERIGNFVLCEDEQTLEGVIQQAMVRAQATLTVVEDFTGGQIAARLTGQEGAEAFFDRGAVCLTRHQKQQLFGLERSVVDQGNGIPMASALAEKARKVGGSTHGLAVLVSLEPASDTGTQNGTVYIALATPNGTVSREAKLAGIRNWVRLGAIEMGLDSLRRHLQGLPLEERTDFEQTRSAAR